MVILTIFFVCELYGKIFCIIFMYQNDTQKFSVIYYIVIYMEEGVVVKRSDRAKYLKHYMDCLFAELELSSMEQRCWFIIKRYLIKDIEFFYMTDSAMEWLLENQFGKKYNSRVVANAMNALVKRGWFVRVDDGLCIVNFYIVFNGNRDAAKARHYDYDLFGTRDPMARNNVNIDINFSKHPRSYASKFGIGISELRNRCLGKLRKECGIKTIK